MIKRKVKPKTKKRAVKTKEAPKTSVPAYGVYVDFQGRTCAEITREGNIVVFVTMEAEDGLKVRRAAVETFEHRFSKQLDYQVHQWFKSMLEFIRYAGASDEALEIMSRYITIPTILKEEIQMAGRKAAKTNNDENCVACGGTGTNSKGDTCSPCKGTGKVKAKATKAAAPKAAAKTKAAPKAAAKTKAAPKKAASKKAAAPKAAAKKTTKAAAPKEKKETVSSYLRELIMQGKLTDDQIFTKVQQKFPKLDDKKRWYVSWYRADMRKKGMNPPDAIKK